MRLKLLSLSALGLMFFVSCRKTDDTPPLLLLSNVAITGAVTQNIALKYNDHYCLTEENDGSTVYKYTYDTLDRLIEENDITSGQTTQYLYKYGNPGIFATVNEITNGTITKTSNWSYTINPLSQLARLTYSTDEYSDYTYDGNGDLISQSDYVKSSPTVFYKFEYAYETGNSYFFNVKGNLFTIHPSAHFHNIKSGKFTTYFNPTNPDVVTYNSTFEYNSRGYPTKEVKVQSTSNSSITSTATYAYTYISVH